jgi:2-aminoadipate transaminase
MNTIISNRILATPPSFIRSILKAANADDVISFAGGLPNPVSFPQDELQESMNRVVTEYGSKVFQYSITAGYEPLRRYIAHKYNLEHGMDLEAEDILITTGSQQALDLIGKVFINEGDSILIEEPGYLGAIQAFTQYLPSYQAIPLEDDGICLQELESSLTKHSIKFAYLIPNYQNPTGITYSPKKREVVRALMKQHDVLLIEDDPYGALCFLGQTPGFIGTGSPENSIILGTFSKIVTPGMRIGYLITKNRNYMRCLNTAKEASDLHSNIFSQYVIHDYLMHHDLETHIEKIKDLYRTQCQAMLDAIELYFPKSVSVTRPKGGMFLWVTLPEGSDSMELFRLASERKVIFVPGTPFYTHGRIANTLRLNYTNACCETIKEGIRRLGEVMNELYK